eukprot:6063111-Pleurochrysis_carterae.AAC.1
MALASALPSNATFTSARPLSQALPRLPLCFSLHRIALSERAQPPDPQASEGLKGRARRRPPATPGRRRR